MSCLDRTRCVTKELTDPSGRSERIEHLGGLVIFRLEPVTFIADNEINWWLA